MARHRLCTACLIVVYNSRRVRRVVVLGVLTGWVAAVVGVAS